MPEIKQDIPLFGSLSEHSLAASFQTFPSPVFLMAPDGKILHSGGAGMTHDKKEKSVYDSAGSDKSGPCVSGYHPVNEALRKEKAGEVLKTGRPLSFSDIRGRQAWMHTMYPIHSGNGDISHLLVIAGEAGIKDIAKRNGRYRDLEVLNALYDAIPASVIVVDAHMRLIGWNQFSRDTVNGKSEDEMPGINPFMRIHPDDREHILGLFLKTLIHNIEGSARFRMHHKDDAEYKWATLRFRRVVIEGHPCIIAVVTETTELKKAEEEQEILQEQLQQSQKMELIGKLAGGIAHDFNNILTGILGNTELLLGMIEPSSPQFDNVRDIQRLAIRSAKLTRQLLAFARKEVVRPRLIELNEAVAELLPLQRRIIGENIQLVFFPSRTPAFVTIDPVQLDQVLTNLFVNARDAISECGTIRISCETANLPDHALFQGQPVIPSGEYVHLSVADSGSGIDDKVLPHIFEPFFTTRELGKGTGLGLSTVYGIVKQNKGHIFCRSKKSKGTTFDIYLPHYGNASREVPEIQREQFLASNRESILLVEDEPYVLRIMQEILENHRFRVFTAANAEEGMEIARKQRNMFSLLVTDVMLPKINGVQLSMQLMKENPNLKVLFMSGYAPESICHMKKIEQESNFIQKPFMINDFMKAVHKVLAHS
jgi:PAS domain S-box-containing protein